MWGHYVIWYLLPTAPPWAYAYISNQPMPSYHIKVDTVVLRAGGSIHEQQLLIQPKPTVDLSHREGAAFARVDAITGYRFFYNMFVGNPVPFAAFPSGHVAW